MFNLDCWITPRMSDAIPPAVRRSEICSPANWGCSAGFFEAAYVTWDSTAIKNSGTTGSQWKGETVFNEALSICCSHSVNY